MSTPKKTLAKGTILKLEEAGTPTTVFSRIETIDLPAMDYEEIEAPELNPVDDSGAAITNDPIELGDEILGQMTCLAYWDPRDTDALQLETWWAAKTELDVEVVTPHATSATITFTAKIKTLGPQQLTKKGYYKRQIVMNRTSAITNAATV